MLLCVIAGIRNNVLTGEEWIYQVLYCCVPYVQVLFVTVVKATDSQCYGTPIMTNSRNGLSIWLLYFPSQPSEESRSRITESSLVTRTAPILAF